MKRRAIYLVLCVVMPLSLSAEDKAGSTFLKRVRVNGVELRYLEKGKGPPVVFVHGGLEDYRAWLPQMDAFAERYRTIAYSRRHNYPNPRAPLGTGYSPIVDADDLAALIGKLKLQPAQVIGVSHGAFVALLLAVRHPELVRSLVLSEPPVMRWLLELEGGKPLFEEFMSKVWEPAARGLREGDEAGMKAAVDGFGELGYSGADEKMTFATLPPEVQRGLLVNAPEWRALSLSKEAFPDLPFPVVRATKTPTLLLSGGRSLVLHGLIDRQLAALLPNSERIVLANATHEMWNEQPEECRSAAFAFFARH